MPMASWNKFFYSFENVHYLAVYLLLDFNSIRYHRLRTFILLCSSVSSSGYRALLEKKTNNRGGRDSDQMRTRLRRRQRGAAAAGGQSRQPGRVVVLYVRTTPREISVIIIFVHRACDCTHTHTHPHNLALVGSRHRMRESSKVALVSPLLD